MLCFCSSRSSPIFTNKRTLATATADIFAIPNRLLLALQLGSVASTSSQRDASGSTSRRQENTESRACPVPPWNQREKERRAGGVAERSAGKQNLQTGTTQCATHRRSPRQPPDT